MIKHDIYVQIFALINSLFLGAFLCLIYDCFSLISIIIGIKQVSGGKRISRLSIPFKNTFVKKIAQLVFDMVYFIVITPVCAIFLYSVNYGILRWYYAVMAMVGILLYRISAGVIIKKIFIAVGIAFRYLINITLTKIKCVFVKLVRKFKRRKGTDANKKNERQKIITFGDMKIQRQS